LKEVTIVIMEKLPETAVEEAATRPVVDLRSHSDDEAQRKMALESGRASRGEQHD
jgi:hypothetical protein